MQKSKIQIIYFKEKEIPVLKTEDNKHLLIEDGLYRWRNSVKKKLRRGEIIYE